MTLLSVVALIDMKTRLSLWDSTSTNHFGLHKEFLVVMQSTIFMNRYAIVVKRNWRNYFRISSCQINKGKNRLTNPMSRGKTVNEFDEKGIKVFCCLFSLPKKIICEGTKRKVL